MNENITVPNSSQIIATIDNVTIELRLDDESEIEDRGYYYVVVNAMRGDECVSFEYVGVDTINEGLNKIEQVKQNVTQDELRAFIECEANSIL